MIYDYRRANHNLIKEFLFEKSNIFVSNANSGASVEELWMLFKHIICKCHDFVPKYYKTVLRRKPWIDRDIIHLKRKCRRLRKQRNKRSSDLITFDIQALERQIRNKLKVKHMAYMSNMANFVKENPRKFWSFVNNSSSDQIDNLCFDNEIIADRKRISDVLNDQFSSVFADSVFIELPVRTGLTLSKIGV